MANSDKNIIITPNTGETENPKIVFSGANTVVGAQNITLHVYPDDNGTLSFEGSSGQLLSITNSLEGVLFSVNDVFGLPMIQTRDDGKVVFNQYGGDVEIGSSKFRFELSRLSSDYDTPTLRLQQQRGMLIKEFGFDDRPGGLWLYGSTNGNIGSQGWIGAGYVGDGGTFRALATSGASIYFDQGATRFYNDSGYTVGTNVGLTERMRITSGGEVYIAGTTDQGAYNLQCNGTGVWGAGAYVNGSDERIKDDIEPITSGLDVVKNLNPVTYRYKESWTKDQSVQTGFIAQELLAALEDQIYVDGVVQQGGSEGYYSVAYQNLIPILTKAIQEQQEIIQSLTARIEALENA